jgi:hypothetical protein
MLTIVFVTYFGSPLLGGCVAATVVLVALSERMLCRSARVLWVDALPLGSSSVGGCFATIVGRMLGRRVLGRMHCHLGRLLRWMLCHLVVSELV